jgi:demethylmenaquinone methyltransferase / 2-methoxy-6-polyprenyl-1,4-benzoquinol methylase
MTTVRQKTNIDKSSQTIGSMFDSIAHRYDFLNHLLSFGIDRRWRKKAVGLIGERFRNPSILDVATGTGDLAIEAIKINPSKITGVDISEKMLEAGRKKVIRLGLEDKIELINCDSENLCFGDGVFDAAMVAFGVRNFSDPVKGLSEMKRVIHKGGVVVVLEFSRPDGFIFKNVYNFYFKYFLPFIGALFSGRKSAYSYLNQSVMEFADKEKFVEIMKEAGFSDITQTRLTFGIATIYSGISN